MNIHDDPDDVEYRTAIELRARKVTEERLHRFENYAAEIFLHLGRI
jgi:hypothetical protein